MYWFLILLFHQPPLVHPRAFRMIVKDSYKRIVEIFKKNPQAKATFCLTASLVLKLEEFGYHRLIKDIKNLVHRRQIDLVDTAGFYAFLPLLPKETVLRQIEINREILERFSGGVSRSDGSRLGFMTPELGYSQELEQILASLGYKFLILDELSRGEDIGSPACQLLCQSANSSLRLIFSNRRISDALFFSPQIQSKDDFLKAVKQQNSHFYFVTANQAEFFGYQRPEKLRLFRSLMKCKEVEKVGWEELKEQFEVTEEVKPQKSTWETLPEEFSRKIFYPTISHPKNKIHQAQWELARLAIKTVQSEEGERARGLLDRNLFCDQYRWVCACRPWGIANIVSFQAARNLAEAVKLAGGDFQKAWELYERIVFTAYQIEKEGWFDEKKPQFDQHLMEYRKSLMPGLVQVTEQEVREEIEKKQREKSN